MQNIEQHVAWCHTVCFDYVFDPKTISIALLIGKSQDGPHDWGRMDEKRTSCLSQWSSCALHLHDSFERSFARDRRQTIHAPHCHRYPDTIHHLQPQSWTREQRSGGVESHESEKYSSCCTYNMFLVAVVLNEK